MNISNSTIDDFRAVFNQVDLSNSNLGYELTELPRKYSGIGMKAVVYFNKVNFYFIYSKLCAKGQRNFNFPGLTREQYVIGASVTADFLNW
jgi:hypothetical protein